MALRRLGYGARVIPLRDTIRAERFPLINVAMVLACAAVWMLELAQGPALNAFFDTWAFVPARLTAALHGQGSLTHAAITVVTSTFMHGGWGHIGGNLLYLWVFGDNVEDRLGKGRYLVFYLVGGIAASLTHWALGPESRVPTVGASGAIAAVLGAYIWMYPQSRVTTFFYFRFIDVPAVPYLGLWFAMQLWSGTQSLLGAHMAGAGGVAWWAHIGGFVAGLVLSWLLAPPVRPRFEAARESGRVHRIDF